DYIMKDLKQTDPRIGIICQDDEIGRDTMRGLNAALKLYGLKLADKEVYKSGAVDFTSQVLNLKRAKANFVILSMTTSEPPLVFKEARKFGYSPQFFGSVGLASDKVVEVSGEDSRGLLVITNEARPDSDVPGAVEYRKSMEKYQPGTRLDFYSLACYGVGMVFAEGARRCGKDLTAEGLVTALETLNKFETGGIYAPITFGPNMRDSVNSGYFLKANPEKKTYDVFDPTWREPTPLK
ncbi:MAG: ABC transporter substrate-binding protein, partial [Pseudomonadota bacterium]